MKVLKTIKLYINGSFPRTESGRSYPVYLNRTKKEYARLCQSSRKDLRNAVTAAKSAQKKWASRTAYNRGQILYRMAEMMEGKREEITAALRETQGLTSSQTKKMIDASIDHLIHFAGFSDKYEQVLGSKNPINGPFHNFTSPTAMGVMAHLSTEEPLDQLIEKIAATVVSGNSVVCLLSKKTEVLLSILGEVCQTSDLPGGVINLLSGKQDELVEHFFSHLELSAISYDALSSKHLTRGKEMASAHLKRVNHVKELKSIALLEKSIEFKTYWHPIGQ